MPSPQGTAADDGFQNMKGRFSTALLLSSRYQVLFAGGRRLISVQTALTGCGDPQRSASECGKQILLIQSESGRLQSQQKYCCTAHNRADSYQCKIQIQQLGPDGFHQHEVDRRRNTGGGQEKGDAHSHGKSVAKKCLHQRVTLMDSLCSTAPSTPEAGSNSHALVDRNCSSCSWSTYWLRALERSTPIIRKTQVRLSMWQVLTQAAESRCVKVRGPSWYSSEWL